MNSNIFWNCSYGILFFVSTFVHLLDDSDVLFDNCVIYYILIFFYFQILKSVIIFFTVTFS